MMSICADLFPSSPENTHTNTYSHTAEKAPFAPSHHKHTQPTQNKHEERKGGKVDESQRVDGNHAPAMLQSTTACAMRC